MKWPGIGTMAVQAFHRTVHRHTERQKSEATSRMLGDFTTCMAMFMNGVWIGTAFIEQMLWKSQLAPKRARPVCYVTATMAAEHRIAVRRGGIPLPRRIATSALVSASPAISSRDSGLSSLEDCDYHGRMHYMPTMIVLR